MISESSDAAKVAVQNVANSEEFKRLSKQLQEVLATTRMSNLKQELQLRTSGQKNSPLNLKFSDMITVLTTFIGGAVKIMEQSGLSGPEKKSAVIALVVKAFDDALTNYDIPGIGGMFENLAKKIVRENLLPALAGSLIDGIVALLNNFGVLGKGGSVDSIPPVSNPQSPTGNGGEILVEQSTQKK